MRTAEKTLRGLRGDGRGWTLLIVAAGWLFISGFRVVLPALLPQIKADFAIDNASAGFALTVLWLVYASLQFPAGLTADRIGERRLLVVGAVAGAIAIGTFYFSPPFTLFLLACALFGVGSGLFGTPRDMLLSRRYPDADSTAYSVTFAAGSLGAAVLPFVATAVASRWGWRLAVVWLFVPMLLVSVGLWWAVSSTPANATTDRLSARETVRRTAGALTDRSVVFASLAMIVFVFTYQALVAFLPTYLVEVKGIDQGIAAALFGLLFVVGAVVQPVVGHFADRYRERTVVLLVILFSTVSLLALPFAEGVVALSVLVPLLGVRIAAAPLASAFIVRELPTQVQGAGWGLIRTLFFALGATGSSVMGLFGDAGLFDAGFVLLAGLTGVAAVVWLRIRWDEGDRSDG
ncbi:MFS transporter [Salinigranum salinum]|uniref:MFS transporter n=1 Tax=Salinigranum salinum TaxID=1364937 RepID=UPI001261126F|nr:MFS transporter [Salinigranum salinum]